MRRDGSLVRVRRAMALVLILAQGACLTPPRPVAQPAPYVQGSRPKRIWVSLANGNQMVIDAPRVFGDTLLGIVRKPGGSEEVWLPLADLQEVRTRRTSGGRTALLTGAIAVTAGLILSVLRGGAGTSQRPCMNEGEPCEGG